MILLQRICGGVLLVVVLLGFALGTSGPAAAQDSAASTAAHPNRTVSREELVTTAAGLQKRRDVGAAVTTLRVDSLLEVTPFASLSELLASRVPGLLVQRTSGVPGDPARLRLRGLGSVRRSNDPVILVDGVRIYAAHTAPRSGNLTNFDPAGMAAVAPQRIYPLDVPAASPLDQIDPNAIELIEVLHGPSAATLYGAEAANGVILITTKRGQQGRTRWAVRLARGRTTMPGTYPTGFYRWGHDAGSGIAQLCPLFVSTCARDSVVARQVLTDPALTPFDHGQRTNFSLTASGGTPSVSYSVTGTYGKETGLLRLPALEVMRFRSTFNREPEDWMQRPHELTTWSVASLVGTQLGRTATLTLATRLARSEQQRASLEAELGTLMGTYAEPVHQVYARPSPIADYTMVPVSALVPNYYVRQTASLLTSTSMLGLEWQPWLWLTVRGVAGLDIVSRSDALLQPAGYIIALPDSDGAVVRGAGRSLTSSVTLSGEVRRPLGAGYTVSTNVGANLVALRTDDQVNSAIGLRPGTTAMTGGRLHYGADFDSRMSTYGGWLEPRLAGPHFAVAAALRLEGHLFPHVGNLGDANGLKRVTGMPRLTGSWVVSEERWFPRVFRALFPSLRLRGIYGQVQMHPGPTDPLRQYTDLDEGLTLTALGNSRLRPERTAEIEGGFDAALRGGALSVALTLYRKTTSDVLLPVTLPPSVADDAVVLQNVGLVRNTGVELAAGVTPLRSSVLTWSAQVLYSQNRNTLAKLGAGVVPDTAAGLVEGHALYSRWTHPIIGFTDANSDGVLQPSEVEVGRGFAYRGQLQPKYTLAVATDVALFHGAIGVAATVSYEDGATQLDQVARSAWVLQRALDNPEAPLAEQAVAMSATRSTEPSSVSGVVHRLATLRFSSLSVSYRVPTVVARLVRAQQLSVAVQGANLGLRSTYGGRDPNVSNWTPSEQVVDRGQLPMPRLWQVAVRLTY